MSEFKLFEYELNTKKLPADFEGFRFVQLADLHNKLYGAENERLLAAIDAQEPDAILVTGDLLVANVKQSFLPAQQLLVNLRRKGYPVFYGNGNHEYRMRVCPETYGNMYEAYTAPLRECGVVFLENEKTVFRKQNAQVTVCGFELEQEYYKKLQSKKLSREEVEAVLGKAEEEQYTILLAHNPVHFPAYAEWGADLTLSGHLHGGIIRLPGIGGLITPQAQLFPRYDAGHFKRGERELIVSRGLGTHTVNIRIFNPAELAVIHLKGMGEETWVSR